MDIMILSLVVAYIALFALVYRVIWLEKRMKTLDKEHRKMVSDAGMALTETLKVAFDSLKQLNQKHEKLSSIVKDNKEKIQNIIIGNRTNNQSRFEKISRLRKAVSDAKTNHEAAEDTENIKDE